MSLRERVTLVEFWTPEFPWERPYQSVAEAMRKLGIRYPVVQGIVRYRHVGEGAYDETEAMIRRLLTEAG